MFRSRGGGGSSRRHSGRTRLPAITNSRAADLAVRRVLGGLVLWLGYGAYLAQAYASTRGSVPALRTPVFGSMAMAAFEPNDHAPAECNL